MLSRLRLDHRELRYSYKCSLCGWVVGGGGEVVELKCHRSSYFYLCSFEEEGLHNFGNSKVFLMFV